ncbi:hypothetical protein ZYGR_0AG03150 [Zygosaccharomyces rouxii]|uniref:F-box domain-containing protein n=1 Tax=Zygosaccharomyces rouxii TaxID=4956 RepID=A0A1Q3A9C4_ZYGRO|nr:hypothetical protein ZYGR_0AG03150 [Zygosaccharomyces rouxii]
MKNLDELPKEVWIEISGWLGASDILQLRLCSRSLCKKLSSRAIWRPRCYEKWLTHLQYDPFYVELKPRDHSWFYHYRFRNHIESRILKGILNALASSEPYHELFPRFVHYKPSHVIPFLHGVIENGYLLGATCTGTGMDVVTICHHLLMCLRHKHVYELFDHEETEYVHDAELTVFLRLSAMDSSFDLLLHHRDRVLQEVHLLVRLEWEEFMKLPATLRIDRLVGYLMQALNHSKTWTGGGSSQLHLEDFILLRVYAGETQGHPLLILTIVQTLASMYGVETVLCGSYLIIRDPKLIAGETYLTVSIEGKPKIFTKKRLIQSLKRILGTSERVVVSQILPSILQPLAYKELVSTIFRELLPLYNKSKWAVASLPKNPQLYGQLYPHSRQPMSAEIVHYFTCVYKACELQSRIEMRISSLYSVAIKEVFRLVSRLYPGDYYYAAKLLHSRGIDFGEHLLKYDEWIFQLHSIAIEQSSKLGTFVSSTRDPYPMCVVGARTFNNGNVYYTLMNYCGEFFVESSSNVREYDAKGNQEVILDFLKTSGFSDLGLVFSQLDREDWKLIPNDRIKKILL